MPPCYRPKIQSQPQEFSLHGISPFLALARPARKRPVLNIRAEEISKNLKIVEDCRTWVSAEQQQHGQAAQVFGSDGYVWTWASATFENWQSEFLQLLTMAVLTSFLIHKGSAESRDSQ